MKFRENYAANREKFIAGKRKWVSENQEYVTAKQREWRNNNIERHLIHTSRSRANRMGLVYTLKLEDIMPLPRTCGYCGRPLVLHYGKRQENSASIDRLKPTLGYTKQNVVICCWKCNRWKNNMTLEELQSLSKNVIRVAHARGLT